MLRRWLIYLATLAGCVIFHYFYGQWLSFLLLACVVLLPLFSLAVSLPSMLLARFLFQCPNRCDLGQELTARVSVRCPLPMPEYRLRLLVTDPAGQSRWLKEGASLPAEHCAALRCRIRGVRVYDYLGLWFLPGSVGNDFTVHIFPRPLQLHSLPELDRYLSQAWRPKAGGGFSENHELRLYRPGDQLNQIHWKLSAKTGKYIIREAMEPLRRRVIVGIVMEPTGAALDRKLGRLWWLCCHLLDQGLPCIIRAMTGSGIREIPVASREALGEAIRTLLDAPRADASQEMDAIAAAWHYTVGGEPDEA